MKKQINILKKEKDEWRHRASSTCLVNNIEFISIFMGGGRLKIET